MKRIVTGLSVGSVIGIWLLTAAAGSVHGQVASLDQRVAGAERVVVATARRVSPEWRENQFGDRLIVSRIELDVEETFKGAAAPTLWLDLEGGTLDGLTLQVSTLPLIRAGERGVFMLNSSSRGAHVPHLRGYGVLMLDEDEVVRGTNLRLNDLRTQLRGLGK